ncbi:MAG: GGDEF domain-containing protein [Sulfurimonas sp.]|nr:GGDEF domain-containing protein [Sulfurimonas sp.]
MKTKLPKVWLEALEILDIAFQPILNIHTGKIFAVESLLRNFQEAGFKSIFSVFDQAFEDRVLYDFDIALREKTFKKYKTIQDFENIKLFYNLDNRLFECPHSSNSNTEKLLKSLEIKKDNIFFEISERHELSSTISMNRVLQHYKNENYSIVIDDFGVGFSGYKLLYDTTPDILKIDRFFLQDIEKNIKKKLMVRNITHLAIQLGIKVVAEGVQTKAELLTCKDIGCHLVQGYLVQRPTRTTSEILKEYTDIKTTVESNKRENGSSTKIAIHLDKTIALDINTKMSSVIKNFKDNPNISIIPIVNTYNEPMGILHEDQIKEFLYSPFGISLLLNDESGKSKLKNSIQRCGTTDINSSISTIIELFSNNPESLGIIITNNSKYYGFLSARAIINLMNEENLILARDQNPLTRLPGNTMIEKYISKSTQNNKKYILSYFDLDNFKAFNDVYGFRNGDRVIQLFADMMRKELSQNFFIAHIGGDDFFLCARV